MSESGPSSGSELLDILLGASGDSGPARGVPRLLIVDDEPLMLRSLGLLLEGQGYRLSAAGSGAEALAILEREVFDLMLLDLHLSDMHGLEVLARLQSRGGDTCTIVVSGDSDIGSAIGALQRGAYDFVRKPFEPEELLRTVANALAYLRDHRENARMRVRLERSERLYRHLVEHSPDFIYTLDQEGCFTFVNRRAETLLGYRREELIGQHYASLVHADDQAVARHVVNPRGTSPAAGRSVELRLKSRVSEAGHPFEISLLSLMAGADAGEGEERFLGTYGIARDIGERRRVEDLIAFQAFHDPVTELPNRALFMDRLELALVQSRRNGDLLAVMLIDLDRFKWVNDTLGHGVGNEALRLVAQRIQGCLRLGDTPARLEADEFALLLPRLADAGDAAEIARRILDAMAPPCHAGGHELYLSASIGIALASPEGDLAKPLMRRADIAMLHVKKGGRNGYAFHDAQMPDLSSVKHALELDLRRAVREGELTMYYQPQMDARDRRIVGVEALMRWRHPSDGVRGAGDIIPLAEEIGLISGLSDWMLEATCADLRAWVDAGIGPVSLSVNISPHYLEQDDFVDRVLSALDRHGVDPVWLEVEITESLAIRNFEDAMHKLGALSAAGVRVAIDDFGTGYSSLAYLQKLPLTTLKIDKAFVNEIRAGSQRVPVVQAVIALAHGLGLEVIGEGVERPEQAEYLLAHGCHLIQGYYYHRPQPAEVVAGLLAGGT